MSKLENKVAIITGATGGIGAAMAEAFAKEGAKIVVVGTNEERGNKTVEAVKAAGSDAFFRKTDLTSVDNLQGLVDDAVDKYGRIDILVNNAGADDPITWAPEDVTEEEYDRVMSVNAKIPFFLSQKVAPIMKKNGGGAIINTASIASTGAGRGPIIYTISKHAILGITRQLAFYYGHDNIRVNCIEPGYIATRMVKEAMKDDSIPFVPLVKSSPAERAGDPSEIAKVAVFLASDDASYLHGSEICADGGFTLI
mgnify:FL=1